MVCEKTLPMFSMISLSVASCTNSERSYGRLVALGTIGDQFAPKDFLDALLGGELELADGDVADGLGLGLDDPGKRPVNPLVQDPLSEESSEAGL
jgi:hypothetical protein